MAEIVELRTEETIPELESMLGLLFDKEDVNSITNMRKDHEYKMNRPTKRKEDCIKYIEFEMKLMRIIRLRHRRKGLQKNSKLVNIEYALGKRLNKIFILTIRWFPEDIRIWVAYIRFCRQMRFYSAASRILEQMLELHGSLKPELYKMAAMWELNECNSVEKARKYLMVGIHMHKDCKVLLIEAIKLELYDAERRRKECLENGVTFDPTNNLFNTRKAEAIYESSVKKLKDVDLLNTLMNICSEYDFAANLEQKMAADLFDYGTEERTHDILARRALEGKGTFKEILTPNKEEKPTPKSKIAECVGIYETAVKSLNTPKMWSYYLDTLLEMSKDTNVLPNYKRKLLLSALQKGSTVGKLTEKYYLKWVSLLQGSEKQKKVAEVLQGAVKKLPESVTLWHTLLRVHLTRGEEKLANQVFEQGVTALAAESLPLWKLMLQFEQTKRNNKVEEIFKKSWTQCPEISGPLKPMYLEWLVLTQGIVVARKAYDQMIDLPPPCIEMHKKMIYLESIQPTINKKKMRQCHTITCAQFGAMDIDVWMDHCKFETSNGDPEKVSEIYWRARTNLSPEIFEDFLSEFTLIRNIPNTTNI